MLVEEKTMIAGYNDVYVKAEERPWNMCTDTERQQERGCMNETG